MFWIRSGLHSISISDWLTAGPVVARVADSGRAPAGRSPSAPGPKTRKGRPEAKRKMRASPQP
jgi:hypothetical protein